MTSPLTFQKPKFRIFSEKNGNKNNLLLDRKLIIHKFAGSRHWFRSTPVCGMPGPCKGQVPPALADKATTTVCPEPTHCHLGARKFPQGGGVEPPLPLKSIFSDSFAPALRYCWAASVETA